MPSDLWANPASGRFPQGGGITASSVEDALPLGRRLGGRGGRKGFFAVRFGFHRENGRLTGIGERHVTVKAWQVQKSQPKKSRRRDGRFSFTGGFRSALEGSPGEVDHRQRSARPLSARFPLRAGEFGRLFSRLAGGLGLPGRASCSQGEFCGFGVHLFAPVWLLVVMYSRMEARSWAGSWSNPCGMIESVVAFSPAISLRCSVCFFPSCRGYRSRLPFQNPVFPRSRCRPSW